MVSHFVKSLLAKSEIMQLPEPRDMLPVLDDIPADATDIGPAELVDMIQFAHVIVYIVKVGDVFYGRIEDEYFQWCRTQYTSGRANCHYWRKSPPMTEKLRKQINGAIGNVS